MRVSPEKTGSDEPPPQAKDGGFSLARVCISLMLGALGALFIWVAAPLNNFFLNNSFISDTYLPVAGVVYLLVLLLVINPILWCVKKTCVINTRQFALIFAILLAAAVIPSQGLLRTLPWSLARTNVNLNQNPRLAEAFKQTKVPPVLFPDDIGFDVPAPASEQLLDQCAPDTGIPWKNWVPVLCSWGVFLAACWLMMVALGMIMFPHWRERERLQFPLLGVQKQLLSGAGTTGAVPSLFKDRLFWIGCGIVVVLYAFNGLNHHLNGKFPAFPLGWNLAHSFTEGMWRRMPRDIKHVGHIYFVLVGMTYFMPTRVGFSLWFTVLAYGFYQMIGTTYFQPFHGESVHDHRNGAMIAVVASTLFLSRMRWVEVARAMVSRATDHTGRLTRMSGWMFTSGCLGIFGWLLWAGVPPSWAALFTFIGFAVCILIARIVAETGLPFIRVTGMNPHYLMSMLPVGWLNATAIYVAGFISLIFQNGSRVSATVMTTHALGLNDEASARQKLRLGWLMIGVLAAGLLIGGVVHLTMGYSASSSIDGVRTPVVTWGSRVLDSTQRSLMAWHSGAWRTPGYNRFGHLLFGIGLATGLQIACMMLPRWPLHPIGLLVAGHFYGNTAWASILIGWTLKTLILRLGGAAGYRKARNFFLGLILGEIFAAIIWTLVPVFLILNGTDPKTVGHIPLLPT